MTWAIMEGDSVTEIKHLSIIYTIILPGDRKSSLDPSCHNNYTLQSLNIRKTTFTQKFIFNYRKIWQNRYEILTTYSTSPVQVSFFLRA